MNRELVLKLLAALAMDEAQGRPFGRQTRQELAAEAGCSMAVAEMELEQADLRGLALVPSDVEELPARVTVAGRQFMEAGGEVEDEVLRFLPAAIDDLYARRALRDGGAVLVDEFRYQLLHDNGPGWAAELVPPAFAEAVDQGLALNLYSAAVALMARLSEGAAAGCVAEEILAVRLMEEAESFLDADVTEGRRTREQADASRAAFNGLFALFEDDDVLDMFEMEEPADAAMAGHTPRAAQLGVADQRLEAWFRPFGGVIATGYLHEQERRQ